jgi:hypothetical protein
MAELAPLLAKDPANPAYRNLQGGMSCPDRGRCGAAHSRCAGAEFPHNARIAINHGHALRTTGRDQAIAEYRRALGLHPNLAKRGGGSPISRSGL